MMNLTIVVAWNGGSPRVSTNCTDPKGSTLSPKNPRRQALSGYSFSLLMPILLKVDAKMISVELPLSTISAVDRFISYYGFYHKRVVMGMLIAFHEEV